MAGQPIFGARFGLRHRPSWSHLVRLLLLIACSHGVAEAWAQPPGRYAFSRGQMGTTFNIVLYAPDSALARLASDAAFARIDTLNQRLSDYLVDSELNRLSGTSGSAQAVQVSEELWTVLAAAQRLAEQTDGAFDVTVGPLTRLWRWAMRRNQLPPEDRLVQALKSVGYRHLVLDSAARAVELKIPDMRLDLGGIAKGFAVDEAFAVLQKHGLTRVLVDGGGDMRLGDPPHGAHGWRVALPLLTAKGEIKYEERLLARTAVATSGATYRYVEVDGIRYSHILDPRTGMGLPGQRLVTVVAGTGMQADALASAVSVLDIKEGLDFVAGMSDVAVRIIDQTSEGRNQRESPAFEAFLVSVEAIH